MSVPNFDVVAPAGCCRFFGTRWRGCYDLPGWFAGELRCGVFALMGGANPGHWNWSDKPCSETGWICGDTKTCSTVHGRCTVTWPPWTIRPSSVTAFGRTHTCSKNNQYPWMSGCTDGAVAWGCGFCFA